MGTWKKIAHGDPFSALTLLEDMYRDESEYRIPHAVYQAVYDLIDMQDDDGIRQSTLWAVLESSWYRILTRRSFTKCTALG